MLQTNAHAETPAASAAPAAAMDTDTAQTP